MQADRAWALDSCCTTQVGEIRSDASAACSSIARRGVVAMKHTKIRDMWVIDSVAAGDFVLMAIPRELRSWRVDARCVRARLCTSCCFSWNASGLPCAARFVGRARAERGCCEFCTGKMPTPHTAGAVMRNMCMQRRADTRSRLALAAKPPAHLHSQLWNESGSCTVAHWRAASRNAIGCNCSCSSRHVHHCHQCRHYHHCCDGHHCHHGVITIAAIIIHSVRIHII